MLTLLLVAVSVGMSNFAAALSIGIPGVDARTRLQVGLVFGVFEAGMPIVGLLLGAQLAAALGRASRWLAAGVLIAVGGYALISAVRGRNGRPDDGNPAASRVGAGWSGVAGYGRLLFAGLALSLDNLAVGFALGSYHTSVVAGAITIGAVSIALALIGLEIGSRIGRRAGDRAEQLAGLLLIGVGVAIASGALS